MCGSGSTGPGGKGAREGKGTRWERASRKIVAAAATDWAILAETEPLPKWPQAPLSSLASLPSLASLLFSLFFIRRRSSGKPSFLMKNKLNSKDAKDGKDAKDDKGA